MQKTLDYKALDFQAKNIRFLEFELNNQCQYFDKHSWCPRYELGNRPVKHLDTKVIDKVLQFFKKYDYDGSVYLSIYNEPTLDHRFEDMIKRVKEILPKCKLQMYTNGIGLNETKLMRYFNLGVDVARLSVYSDEDIKKYNKIINRVREQGYKQFIETPDRRQEGWLGHDCRIKLYNGKENPEINSPCYMPIQYFCVNCENEVMLCWDDWKLSKTWGNLRDLSVEDILLNPDRLFYIQNLKESRHIYPCSGCTRPTELCISEYRQDLKL